MQSCRNRLVGASAMEGGPKDMSGDVTVTHRPERGRVALEGRRTDDGSKCTLLIIHENDGSWSVHGLGAPGVRLTKVNAVAVAEAILASAR
jgi:hypothetical protein